MFTFLSAKPIDQKHLKVIGDKYPNYKIVDYKNFNEEDKKFIKNKVPGFVVGDFNGDSLKDFAALIHSNASKKYDAGKNSYNFYDGVFIICHGNKSRSFNCLEQTKLPITRPYNSFLKISKLKNLSCYQSDGRKKTVKAKHDSIGWYYPERGGSVYVFQRGEKYLDCAVSD
ncbi:MAG: hypothetical protein K9K67_08420 [Bacteriovoracaceae bacterium]|nr:hypothetical protein [Bacteriovoracaceae bacterium]